MALKRITIRQTLTRGFIFGIALLTISCKTWDELPELAYNRWVEQVPNVLLIDSTRVRALDSDKADIKVYFNFDRQAFEAEWDEVEAVRFSFKDLSLGVIADSLITDVTLDELGKGLAIPQGVKTENQYQMRHQIALRNGRNSVWSSTFQINTPSF